MTKDLSVLGILALILTCGSCASMNFDNYRLSGEETVFEADFSSIPQGIKIEQPAHINLDDGALHFRAPEGDALGVDVPVRFTEPAALSFKMKLGESINPPHPPSHINFYTGRTTEGWKRVCLNFCYREIGSFYQRGDTFSGLSAIGSGLGQGSWEEVVVLADDGKLTVFINGDRRGSVSLPGDYQQSGGLNLECHNEMWIDDLEIVQLGSYDVVKS